MLHKLPEWMTLEAVESVLNLAEQGVAISLNQLPKEPGMSASPDYQQRIGSLASLAGNPDAVLGSKVQPFLEDLDGHELPLYRTRIDGDTLICFIAHPEASDLTYPMEYGRALRTKEHVRNFRFTWVQDGKISSSKISIVFAATESKLLEIKRVKERLEIVEMELPAFKA